MRLIGSGRASEVFDLGEGRVLRQFRTGGDAAREALVMRHAASAGFPVPRVFEVRDGGLVLERIEGRTMVDDASRPWTYPRHAGTLARLHQQLHAIPAPREVGRGALLHLDLHPANVIMSPSGPVVIDWTNAGAGDPALDVAMAWVILATSAGLRGRLFASYFLTHFDRKGIEAALPAAAELRLADQNVTEKERVAIRRLAG